MVTINGVPEQAAGMTVLAWLQKEDFSPETVVVEKNLEIISGKALETTVLEDGDKVEILRFVGGG